MIEPLVRKLHREVRFGKCSNDEKRRNITFIEQAVYSYWGHCELFPVNLDAVFDQSVSTTDLADTQIRQRWTNACLLQNSVTSTNTQHNLHKSVYSALKGRILSVIPTLEKKRGRNPRYKEMAQTVLASIMQCQGLDTLRMALHGEVNERLLSKIRGIMFRTVYGRTSNRLFAPRLECAQLRFWYRLAGTSVSSTL